MEIKKSLFKTEMRLFEFNTMYYSQKEYELSFV
jgi:hypothetical protein